MHDKDGTSETAVRGHDATREKRFDIQALRALAVTLVVAQHLKLPHIEGGYLGVDIFFVISGFLITSQIVDRHGRGTFRFADFYTARLRRLMPASLATVVVTVLLAPFLLDRFEYGQMLGQLAGVLTFSTNIVLWKQTDYFGSGAAVKPFLHMWSLAVEEQYYLLMPLLAVACPKRWRGPVFAALTAGSLGLYVYGTRVSPSAAFYFLPTRAWELGLGSLAALLSLAGREIPKAFLLRCAALACLVLTPVLVTESGGGLIAPLAVCLATVVILLSRPGSDTIWRRSGVSGLGDRSYSLYLVHWPVIAFANNIYVAPQPPWLALVLLALCLAWMELQYRFVEERFRHRRFGWKYAGVLAAVALAAGGYALAGSWMIGGPSDRGPNRGLGSDCSYGGAFTDKPVCRTGPNPKLMVWGDSFAMHLVLGLKATNPAPLVQATKFTCGPFVDIAPLDAHLYPQPWAESCIAFNRSVIEALAKTPEIDTVVISSSLAQYLDVKDGAGDRLLILRDGAYQVAPRSQAALLEALGRTVEALHRAGKRVVLVGPPPASGSNLGRCQERRLGGLPTVAVGGQCDFPLADAHRRQRSETAFIEAVQRAKLVPTISLSGALCGSGACATQMDRTPLYFDEVHLSRAGSRTLAERMDLAERIRSEAR